MEGEIDGITYVDEYKACTACKSKVKSKDDLIVECTKCGIMMKHNHCTKSITAKTQVTEVIARHTT